MKLHIAHHTVFSYSRPIEHAVQRLYLHPQTGPTQQVLSWQVSAPGRLCPSTDGLGNVCETFSLTQGASSVHLRAEGEVDNAARACFDEAALLSPLYYSWGSDLAEAHPRISDWAQVQLTGKAVDETQVLVLAQAVAQRVRYRSGKTGVQTEALEAFDWGWGVCQDQAHVMVAACRGLGWPARYVSGYFFDELAPDLASHAWVDVCLDVARQRWLSVDVTHACLTDERHVRLAVGRDYAQCSPTRGVRRGGGQEQMAVSVQIQAL